MDSILHDMCGRFTLHHSTEDVAERFAVGEATRQRWVRRQRDTGTLDPFAKAGGWASPVDVVRCR